ncbi:flagellum-specific ATP synthase FliI [Phaeobacter gallaeciensis]|uniref:Flagellum-specific ATP synthase FliI n=2 Tax=Roseobacteraceae TaxID=2854170 RepID=A0A366X1D5_9RHOB|nr:MULTISPECIES: FliI/YscN family ATPase [Roseobacteraceae]MBT3141272.1 FliI/YscN family ATPase [Falsiruegeria litorea]MBT8170729.1 FliI/YscN family ATPase [Falsiruegeria litorea]RBW54416.1 flagellum-specific ATP synthase FliI [Phaeobacter gallaeciensis]
MSALNPLSLKAELDAASLVRHIGRVVGVKNGMIQIQGLAQQAKIGDQLELHRNFGPPLIGETLQVDQDLVNMLPDSAPEGVSVGSRVILRQAPGFAPGSHWLGRVVDPFGHPLDGRPLLRGNLPRDLMQSPPPAVTRKPLGERMETGLAVLNTMLPIVQGQRVGLFAGSGVGKSSLMAGLAKTMQADAVVVALIGERGREVNEFVEKTLGPEGMERAIVVAATSDQSALVRRRCAWAAMAAAESLRDEGMNVLFLADSITRFAEAHREISVAMGEAPALRGYPPSVTPLITGLCERAGPGTEDQGDITAVFSVLVAGSDMDEPVADILRGVLDGHIVLDRDIAERGRYPAIDVSRSVSRSLPAAATDTENQMISNARRLLGAYEQSEVMIKAGLYAEGSDPSVDQAIRAHNELDQFFARIETNGAKGSFDQLNLILRRAGVQLH